MTSDETAVISSVTNWGKGKVMMSNKVIGGAQFPCIELPKLGGGRLNLGAPEKKTNWKMVVVYRGGHCPMCTRYLRKIGEKIGNFQSKLMEILKMRFSKKIYG